MEVRRCSALALASASASSRRSVSPSRCSSRSARSPQSGGTHLQLAAPPAEHRSSGVEPGSELVLVAGGLGFGGLTGFELGHDRLQLGDASPLGGHGDSELVAPDDQRLLLDEDLASLGLHPGERFGGGREAPIVELEALGDLDSVATRRSVGARRRRLVGAGFGQRLARRRGDESGPPPGRRR